MTDTPLETNIRTLAIEASAEIYQLGKKFNRLSVEGIILKKLGRALQLQKEEYIQPYLDNSYTIRLSYNKRGNIKTVTKCLTTDLVEQSEQRILPFIFGEMIYDINKTKPDEYSF